MSQLSQQNLLRNLLEPGLVPKIGKMWLLHATCQRENRSEKHGSLTLACGAEGASHRSPHLAAKGPVYIGFISLQLQIDFFQKKMSTLDHGFLGNLWSMNCLRKCWAVESSSACSVTARASQRANANRGMAIDHMGIEILTHHCKE